MRVTDPVGGVPDLARFFSDYDKYLRDLNSYEHDLQRIIASYSRGDSAEELRLAYEFAVRKVIAADPLMQAKYSSGVHVFTHRGNAAQIFRSQLVLLSLGLCLHGSRVDAEAVLRCGERGDPITETLAAACGPGLEVASGSPTYYERFDGLYDAIKAPSKSRASCIGRYLQTWYDVKMDGFSFKGNHLLKNSNYVGYWCVEAAGVVAALDIDDSSFADHPLYPRDLVAFFRAPGNAR
jgi:PoNe immunity protein PoNi